MRLLISCLVLGAFLGCSKEVLDAPPLDYSFMPDYLDLDSIHINLPDDPDTLVSSDAIDFKPKYVAGGQFFSDEGDTAYLPPGILISERSSVKYVFYEAGYRRQTVELEYMKHLLRDYHDKSLDAERLYQREIKRLREVSKRSWLERHMGYIGFAAGILTMAIQQFALVKILD